MHLLLSLLHSGQSTCTHWGFFATFVPSPVDTIHRQAYFHRAQFPRLFTNVGHVPPLNISEFIRRSSGKGWSRLEVIRVVHSRLVVGMAIVVVVVVVAVVTIVMIPIVH